MAFLTILAIGTFGLLIAGVSHISISRERKALLEARARLAEVKMTPEETVAAGKPGRGLPPSASVSGRRPSGRMAQITPKQYRRVRGEP